ncbi:hypothetical protein [Pelosinus fermentans]|uniref:Uncharacterized protein n=1 Tax=Pelosinus fermentans JBW45 TaxID=1192197 RepID=I9NSP4_9FIRM|nr:hypothetical protein [Pelosinus fermentans]AJQ28863.1 hypothetical protein JBW_03524 [Pelosinus fermentans JBW45]
MSENLFAYAISNYVNSQAGAITGSRSTSSVDTAAAKAKITGLNGDAAFFNFFEHSNSRLVLRQYNVANPGSLINNQIIQPQGNWAVPLASHTWAAVRNLHAVASKGNWLYATGYDLGKIAAVNMTSDAFTQTMSYEFPLTVTGDVHGEGLAVIGDYLYVLFSSNPEGGYEVYADSYVLQYEINTNGTLNFITSVRVGRNGFTLEPWGNQLYICALGGVQNAGSGNALTRLSIVTIDEDNEMSVNNVALPSGWAGDFRDISIANANNAYVFVGHYNSSFSAMEGKIYRSTVANLANPSTTNWTVVDNVNSGGYFWGIQAESTPSRFWFVRGNQIDAYSSLPTTTGGTPTSFNAAALNDAGYTEINSACFIAPDAPAAKMAAGTAAASAKGFVGQARLARQAKALADELKKKNP